MREKSRQMPELHAMIIDHQMSRMTETGSGRTIEDQYSEALKKHGVKCNRTGTDFTWGVADPIAGIGACLTALRNRQPTTKILLLGVLPSIRSDWATETTLAINRGLAARYRDASVATYMDVGHIFMKNGKVDPDMFVDPQLTPPQKPLHPTPQAQNLISAAIEPTLSRMLGDHPHA
jgi:hypothetical protein